jgi:E3 ubiquitin ligase SMURF1/2
MFFDYKELELVICGIAELDIADWKRFTVVSSSFDAVASDWFWSILTDMSVDSRRKFLQFATGSSRVPVQGK